MIKIAKIYPKDFIALVILIISMYLIYLGINSVVSGIVIMVVTYYFTNRVNEELYPEGNLKKRVNDIEEKINIKP